MAKNTPDEKKPKRRTEVKPLPPPKKELSKEEQKKVKGGSMIPGIGTAVGAAERK